ncbi:MAG: HAD family hydrolase [Promethearchaeota archaeon]
MSKTYKMPKKISCVLFDLDNTLVGIPNTYSFFDTIIQEVVGQDFHLSVPSKEARDNLWRSGNGFIEILAQWGISHPNHFWEYFDKRDAVKRKELISRDLLILYPDVIPTLDKLRGQNIPMGIVTNTPNFIALPELEHFQLDPYFGTIIGQGDKQEKAKPEPDGILEAIRDLSVKPDNAIFVGDSSVDVLAANNAGVYPILISRKNRRRSSSKRLQGIQFSKIDSLNDIFSLFSI